MKMKTFALALSAVLIVVLVSIVTIGFIIRSQAKNNPGCNSRFMHAPLLWLFIA